MFEIHVGELRATFLRNHNVRRHKGTTKCPKQKTTQAQKTPATPTAATTATSTGALHPLRGAAPVTWRCTRTEEVHCLRIGCSAPVLVAVVAAVGVVGVFWACVVFCLGHFVVPLWRLMLWFLRNVACNSPARMSNVEIAPLELQRFGALQKVRVSELHASFG